MLVAPADPERFSPLGLRADAPAAADTLATALPKQDLGFPSLVVASSNDPWMTIPKVSGWTQAWGSRFIDIGQAGHINTESGFGPWPAGLALLHLFQRTARAAAAPSRTSAISTAGAFDRRIAWFATRGEGNTLTGS